MVPTSEPLDLTEPQNYYAEIVKTTLLEYLHVNAYICAPDELFYIDVDWNTEVAISSSQ